MRATSFGWGVQSFGLAADADPAETERLVALGMTVVRRLLEKYRP